MELFEMCLWIFFFLLVYTIIFIGVSNDKRDEWKTYAVCPSCNYKKVTSFRSLVHTHLDCCPKCAEDIDNFKLKIMRFNNTNLSFWKPWAWGDGRWEEIESCFEKYALITSSRKNHGINMGEKKNG